MSDVIREQVLDATRAYFAAFARCDLPATMSCWSNREDTSCVPPLGDPGFGRNGVEEVYRGAFELLEGESFAHEVLSVAMEDPLAAVICAEHITNSEHGHLSELLSTNVFVLECDGWRILHRHVSWRATREVSVFTPGEAGPGGAR